MNPNPEQRRQAPPEKGPSKTTEGHHYEIKHAAQLMRGVCCFWDTRIKREDEFSKVKARRHERISKTARTPVPSRSEVELPEPLWRQNGQIIN
jgi:hypothetical protein